MDNESVLSCSVNVEWTNARGIVHRKLTQKAANLRLIRSDRREIFLEISSAKSAAIKILFKGVSIHKKFMHEGKASIKFPNCNLFISNAPPGQLFTFLRTIFVKMTGQKPDDKLNTSLRTQLLSNKPNQFDEISPVTAGEVDRAKAKVSKTTDTTPSPGSRKRKLEKGDTGGGGIAKKLYSASPIPNEPLDLEQKEILDACLGGANVFFTGSAGTGKSYLLRRIIGALPPDVTVATASTGVAACQIGGITLHQFAAIGDGKSSLERSVQLASKSSTIGIWRKTKHLIVDEISMIDGAYFEKIESVARTIRRNEKPFGGIQLIFCGDFLQLPPVIRDKTKSVQFCFQTPAWENCRLTTFELKRVHRQNDQEFISILNQVRLGRVPEEMAQKLAKTAKQKIETNGILATRLCSHTQDANLINESKLQALEGEKKLFTAEDSDPHLSHQIDQHTSVPSRLELKVGAQVMLLKNINVAAGLVNGARGVIKSFREGLPVVQFRTKEYVTKHERWLVKTASGVTLARKQVPLKLAWAFSIHKSQGLTLDCVEMSLGKVFEAGQAYVALSRAQSLEGLRVLDFKASQVWANSDVLKFYQSLNLRMEQMRLVPLGKKEVVKKSIKRFPSIKAMNKPLVTIN